MLSFIFDVTYLKFIYSEKNTKFCVIFTLILTGTSQDKSKVKILQNFVAFSGYMNFKYLRVSNFKFDLQPPHIDSRSFSDLNNRCLTYQMRKNSYSGDCFVSYSPHCFANFLSNQKEFFSSKEMRLIQNSAKILKLFSYSYNYLRKKNHVQYFLNMFEHFQWINQNCNQYRIVDLRTYLGKVHLPI